jgi:hypothetical protein
MVFYKYYPLNLNTLNSLVNSYFWFSDPKDFNDPFDTKLFYRRIKSISESLQYLEMHYKHGKITIDDYLQMKEVLSYAHENESFASSLFEGDNNPFEPHFAPLRIFCLSTKYNCLQMWGHYSEKNTGLCIGIQAQELNINGIKYWIEIEHAFENTYIETNGKKYLPLLKVKYSNTIRELINPINMDISKQFNDFVFSKERNWKYESEWRSIIPAIGNDNNKIKYNPQIIRCIHFGLRCTDENQKMIIEILNAKNVTNLRYYKMIESETSYRLLRKRFK